MKKILIILIVLGYSDVFGQSGANYSANINNKQENYEIRIIEAGNEAVFVLRDKNNSDTNGLQLQERGKVLVTTQMHIGKLPTLATSGFTAKLNLFGARNATGNSFGTIAFKNYDENGSSVHFDAARIVAFKDGNDDGALRFEVSNNKVLSTAMTIDKLKNANMAGNLTVAGSLVVEGTISQLKPQSLFRDFAVTHSLLLGGEDGDGSYPLSIVNLEGNIWGIRTNSGHYDLEFTSFEGNPGGSETITFGNDGRITATSFMGDGSQLTGISVDLDDLNDVPGVLLSNANTFFGKEAGNQNTSGIRNSFFGISAGRLNTTGNYNSFFGNSAGHGNTTGNHNSFFGTASGHKNEGDGNVFLGYKAGYYETGSNRLYISNSDTDEPLIYGDFDNQKLVVNGDLEVTGTLQVDLKDLSVSNDEGTLISITNNASSQAGSYVGVSLVNNRNHAGETENWIFGLLDDDFLISEWDKVTQGINYFKIHDSSGDIEILSKLTVHEMIKTSSLQIGDNATPEGYSFSVDGKVIAEEVTTLNSANWPDFVFEEDYELESLEEVEEYIEANGHLEHIPTTAEVEEKGINLGEMDAKLLRKIEELTLHMIGMNKLMNKHMTGMNKRLEELEKENSQLRKETKNEK